jgi:hypothetical protein
MDGNGCSRESSGRCARLGTFPIMTLKEISKESADEGLRGRWKTRELRESTGRRMDCAGRSQAWTIGICLCGGEGHTLPASNCKRVSLGGALAQKHEQTPQSCRLSPAFREIGQELRNGWKASFGIVCRSWKRCRTGRDRTRDRGWNQGLYRKSSSTPLVCAAPQAGVLLRLPVLPAAENSQHAGIVADVVGCNKNSEKRKGDFLNARRNRSLLSADPLKARENYPDGSRMVSTKWSLLLVLRNLLVIVRQEC